MGNSNSKANFSFVRARAPLLNNLDWNATNEMEVRPTNAKLMFIKEKLAKGTFGDVFLIAHQSSTKHCAVKFISKVTMFDYQMLETVQQEIDICGKLRHSFICKYLSCYETSAAIGLVFEFAYGGSLASRLKQMYQFSPNEAKFYVCEVYLALQHLHQDMKIVHRDVRLDNILVDCQGHVKLTDFGSACYLSPPDELRLNIMPPVVDPTTQHYWAPELQDQTVHVEYAPKLDWWSLGCVLLAMLLGTSAINGGQLDMLLLKLPFFMKTELKKLLRGLLKRDPAARHDGDKIQISAWFNDVNWEDLEAHRIFPPWKPISPVVMNDKYFRSPDEDIVFMDPLADIDARIDFYAQKIVIPQYRRSSVASAIQAEQRRKSLKAIDDALNPNPKLKVEQRTISSLSRGISFSKQLGSEGGGDSSSDDKDSGTIAQSAAGGNELSRENSSQMMTSNENSDVDKRSLLKKQNSSKVWSKSNLVVPSESNFIDFSEKPGNVKKIPYRMRKFSMDSHLVNEAEEERRLIYEGTKRSVSNSEFDRIAIISNEPTAPTPVTKKKRKSIAAIANPNAIDMLQQQSNLDKKSVKKGSVDVDTTASENLKKNGALGTLVKQPSGSAKATATMTVGATMPRKSVSFVDALPS